MAGFADATGRFLPLVATLNAARVLDAACDLLGVDHDGLAALALAAPAGADGLVLVPYLEGERTPNRPDATGALHGMRLATSTPTHLARAMVEGMLCGLADGLDALRAQGAEVRRLDPDRRRRSLEGGTADRADGARLAGHGSGRGRVRRGRCCPAGRLGAGRQRRAAAMAAGGRQLVRSRADARRCANATPPVRDLTAPQV